MPLIFFLFGSVGESTTSLPVMSDWIEIYTKRNIEKVRFALVIKKRGPFISPQGQIVRRVQKPESLYDCTYARTMFLVTN